MSLFGISMAQASADFQKYQELNPGALHYNLNAKRYEGAGEMRCVRHEPSLVEAIGSYLDGGGGIGAVCPGLNSSGGSVRQAQHLGFVVLPVREAGPDISRWVFQAVLDGRRLRIRYWSVRSGRASWRWIAPHAFAYDGYRWHVRAWCFENEAHRDFVLSRCEKSEPPARLEGPLPADEDWEKIVTLKLSPSRALSPEQRAAIQRDYGMGKKGTMTIEVRQAMKPYLLSHLFLSGDKGGGEPGQMPGPMPRHLELGE